MHLVSKKSETTTGCAILLFATSIFSGVPIYAQGNSSGQATSSTPATSTQATSAQITSTSVPSAASPQTSAAPEPAKQRLEFNLSSTVPQILASHHHSFQLAEISVAGTTKTIIPTDLLTPAEYVALHQVLLSGTQLVQLGEKGNATGGRFKIDPALAAAIQDLANANQPSDGEPAPVASSAEDKERLKQRNTVASPTLAEEEFIEVGGTSRVITGAAVIVGKKKRGRQPGH